MPQLTTKKILLILTSALLTLYLIISLASPLKTDETVFFFPTAATQEGPNKWRMAIHHWVFEKEEGDLSRKIGQKIFSEIFESLGVSEEQADSPVIKQRLMWFLVDNERYKQIEILINGKLESLNLSSPNGHAFTTINLSKKAKPGEWINFKVEDAYHRRFSGEVQLIPETGTSIISDIDDTIKLSNVLDKKELIKNTFVEPYKITEGFPDYYAKLQADGAFFHYVSASPWQFYPSLKPFLDKYYPKGSISLRNFRVKDSSLIKFLQSSLDYKTKQIVKIIKQYPKHKFILIGDSGEHDPEVYSEIYRQFPSSIKSIQIRAVKGSDLSNERFSKTFKDVPNTVWKVFSKPGDL